MVLGVSRTLGTESVVVRTVMESSLLELITANDAVMHFLRIPMPSSTPGGLRSFDSDVDGILFPLTPFFLFLQSPDLILTRRPCSS